MQRPMFNRREVLTGLLFVGGSVGVRAQASVGNAANKPNLSLGPDDIASPEGLPDIGKWMIAPDGTIAHWLGASYEGKHLREPINVVLIDRGAATPEDAEQRLVVAATAAGYPSRTGHSGGYSGFIGGELYPQLPSGHDRAFSDFPFEFNNNHGRIFGPAPHDDGYLFVGAFSRERVAPLSSPRHQYESFDRARDDFTQRLDAKSGYRIVGFVDLGNAIVGDPLISTGDHDGRAVMLLLEN